MERTYNVQVRLGKFQKFLDVGCEALKVFQEIVLMSGLGQAHMVLPFVCGCAESDEVHVSPLSTGNIKTCPLGPICIMLAWFK